ncbi:hypothetical protein O6H91_21G035100 [Diphasiastrum complanatum]|uniref:Uncharacterized protein n=1 Tax=Diphasiastrum complanatum TaxID=34168 RepID=A0ACC2AKP1_DIPCM|nr:hypothetical protein O6H91_21G035100 [Diphasiastrum complanatum]
METEEKPVLNGEKHVVDYPRYTYECEGHIQALASVHRIIVKQRKGRFFKIFWLTLMLCSFLLIFNSIFVSQVINGLECIFLLSTLIVRMFQKNEVTEEAVILMPMLGVQLETSYHSGKVMRRFLPMQKILAAVINEAVTPTTCYFYLALLVREKSELTLVFQEVRPPLDVLISIWKALNDATNFQPNYPASIG